MSVNLQDYFLNKVRTAKIPVTVHLTNGYQLKGAVTGFDAFVILLDAGGKQTMIYKHGITTISPMKPVDIIRDKSEEQGEKADDQAE